MSSSSPSPSRIILVTGANKGIGYAAVRLLSEKNPNDTILLACRDVSAGAKAIQKMKSTSNASTSYDNIKVIELEVTNRKSIQAAAEKVKKDYSKLDILINNAGISNLNGDRFSPAIFDVNVIGAKDTLETFLPIIPYNGKIIVVSSEVGSWTLNKLPSLQKKLQDIQHLSWDDINSLMQDKLANLKGKKTLDWGEGFALYGLSKTFISAYTRIFARDHPQVKVCVVCPGYCATDLNGNRGGRPAAVGGESIIWPVSNEFKNGEFYQDGKVMSYNYPPPPQYAHLK